LNTEERTTHAACLPAAGALRAGVAPAARPAAGPPTRCFLHVDAKADRSQFGFPRHVPTCSVSILLPVYWAGFSVVEADDAAYPRPLWLPGTGFEKLVLLSGSCYPIRPMSELVEYLTGGQAGNTSGTCRSPRIPHALRQLAARRWFQEPLPAVPVGVGPESPSRADRGGGRRSQCGTHLLPRPYRPHFGSPVVGADARVRGSRGSGFYQTNRGLDRFLPRYVRAGTNSSSRTVVACSDFRIVGSNRAPYIGAADETRRPRYNLIPPLCPADANRGSGRARTRWSTFGQVLRGGRWSAESAPNLDLIDQRLLVSRLRRLPIPRAAGLE